MEVHRIVIIRKISFFLFFLVMMGFQSLMVETAPNQPQYFALNTLRSAEVPETNMFAPGNLSAIVVFQSDLEIQGIAVNVEQFIEEWDYVFNFSLPLITLSLQATPYGVNITDPSVLNQSLIIGDVHDIVDFEWPAANEENLTVLTPWVNNTFGSGWALYAGSLASLTQALAYYGSTLDRVEVWDTARIIAPDFYFLLGNYNDLANYIDLPLNESMQAFDAKLQELVKRGFNSLFLFVQYENIANISLVGYEELDHADIYQKSISLLKNYIALAANYSIEIYLNTDELSLTEAQYKWLITDNNLNYTGLAAKEEYPNHLSTNAPGLWRFWQAKYDALVESLQNIITPEISGGFGGFYFRTADQSNPYAYQFDILPTNDTAFQRFINLSCDAAAQLNARVIHRMWRLGQEESVFNNATLAQALLDPIQADNLILRCKETWNDHWYDHPPNPVIGVSHHPWIIGWYMGAAMPDYKGIVFDYYFNESGWQTNPNIIGYDGGPLSTVSYRRLDNQPFLSANAHYLYMKRWDRNIGGNQTLQKYLPKYLMMCMKDFV